MNIPKIWGELDSFTQKCISISILIISCSFGLAIGRSTGIKVSQDGFEMQKQAYQNQKTAQDALRMLLIQQVAIEQLEADLQNFARKYKAGEPLVDKVKAIEKFVSKTEIKAIEDEIEESEEKLAEETL